MKKFLFLLLFCVGCQPKSDLPVFSLWWSEYPSFSVFGVADMYGLVDGRRGYIGPIEKTHGVDIVLQEADYVTCIKAYSSHQADAVCITNIDVLQPSLSRRTTAILPTSTSDGADALLVAGWDGNSIGEFLKNKKVYGAQKTVSELMFYRNIESLGLNPNDYQFLDMDPGAAAISMQTGNKEQDAIVVWNPFKIQTLRNRNDVKVGFDSTTIPEEIIDMVGIGSDILEKEGGREFAFAICDLYYQFNEILSNPSRSDDAYIALGAKFSSLGLEDMKLCCKETKFYNTPEKGIELFNSNKFAKIMENISKFCVEHQIADSIPVISYEKQDGNLIFTSEFMNTIKQ